MGVCRDKPDDWKADIAQSVDLYNQWFLRFAPQAFRKTRLSTIEDVSDAMSASRDLLDISVSLLKEDPSLIRTLRMSTCPPLALDRVVGLAGVTQNLVRKMEKGQLPPRMSPTHLDIQVAKIIDTLAKLLDRDIFVWVEDGREPTQDEKYRAAAVVADRLCGADANPIVRNAQEKRQLRKITSWLRRRGYRAAKAGTQFDELVVGTYALHLNVPIEQDAMNRAVNISVDVVIKSKRAKRSTMPVLLEAKSAGDFANVNKRRKEEATKIKQLQNTYGQEIKYVLFLCGYFDSGYLGYEAAEGIDWVWEHRIEDLEKLEL